MRRLGRLDHDECAPWCNHEPEEHHPLCFDPFCSGIGRPYYQDLGENLPKSEFMGDCFWLANYAQGKMFSAYGYLCTYYNRSEDPGVDAAANLLFNAHMETYFATITGK